MNFIDEATIYLKAGNGGNGAVSFHRAKYIDKGGPDGGNGGCGGSIVIKSNAQIKTLINFKHKIHFIAKNGENGKSTNRTGKSRDCLMIEVPVGTQIFSKHSNVLLHDFIVDKQTIEILKGGRGGLGNHYFKSSINQSPKHSTKGVIGEEMWLNLQLKLLADVGLVGFPNVGKTSFLSIATCAKPRIADYPFTTLTPNLGIFYSTNDETFVMADIPGIIEKAYLGKGLGFKFLKHIERCNILVHLLSLTTSNIVHDYKVIRNELELYSNSLKNKKEIICLNKSDLSSDDSIKNKTEQLEKITKSSIFVISAYKGYGVTMVIKNIIKILKNTSY